MNEAVGGIDGTELVDEVSRSLRQGCFLLLICGDGIREGVATITDFLERHGTLQFTFGLIETAVYRTPGGGLLVQPRVLAQSLIVNRSVIELASEEMVVVEEGAGDEALDDLGAYCMRFWTQFRKKLVLDDPATPLPNPSTKGNVFITMPKGSGSWITVFCNKGHERVGVFLTFYRGALGDRMVGQLKDERESIDAELDAGVDWVTRDGRHRISSRKRFPDIRDPGYRDEIHDFLADRANCFVNAFRHPIERIVFPAGSNSTTGDDPYRSAALPGPQTDRCRPDTFRIPRHAPVGCDTRPLRDFALCLPAASIHMRLFAAVRDSAERPGGCVTLELSEECARAVRFRIRGSLVWPAYPAPYTPGHRWFLAFHRC